MLGWPVLLDWSGGVPVPVPDQPQLRGLGAEDGSGEPGGHLLPAVQTPARLPPHTVQDSMFKLAVLVLWIFPTKYILLECRM